VSQDPSPYGRPLFAESSAMIPGLLIPVSLILGYLVPIGLSMAVAFGLTKSAPGFVLKDSRLTGRYKWFQELFWFASVTLGAYLSALVSGQTNYPIFTATLLGGILVMVPNTNTWETWQRGFGHQILLTFFSIAGVVLGYYLVLR
jgi:hypothetical protein